ncbi:polychome-like protein [Tanacetum coccineum]
MESTPRLVFSLRDGLTFGTPTPSKVVYEDNADQDPSSGAHFEHESLWGFRVFSTLEEAVKRNRYGSEGTADQDPLPSGAHFKHESLVTPKPNLAYITTRLRGFSDQNSVTKELMIFDDFADRNSGDSEFFTPSKELLKVIDKVKKMFMEELNNLKRTPAAKKAEREKRAGTDVEYENGGQVPPCSSKNLRI